ASCSVANAATNQEPRQRKCGQNRSGLGVRLEQAVILKNQPQQALTRSSVVKCYCSKSISKSPAARRAGSSPASGTIIFKSPPTYSVAATAATAATRPAGTPRIALRWQAMFDAAGDARRELSDFSHTCARSRTGSPVPRSQRPFRSIPSKQRKSDPAQQKAQHYDTKVEYWNDQEHQS